MRDNNGWKKKHAATRLFTAYICPNYSMCTGAMRKEHSDAVRTHLHTSQFLSRSSNQTLRIWFPHVWVCACVLLTFDLYEWRNYLQCQWHGWVSGGNGGEICIERHTIQWLAINIQCDMLWSFFHSLAPSPASRLPINCVVPCLRVLCITFFCVCYPPLVLSFTLLFFQPSVAYFLHCFRLIQPIEPKKCGAECVLCFALAWGFSSSSLLFKHVGLPLSSSENIRQISDED